MTKRETTETTKMRDAIETKGNVWKLGNGDFGVGNLKVEGIVCTLFGNSHI